MKKLGAVAVFVVTLAVAILVTKYYGPQPAPPQPPPVPPVGVGTIPPPPPVRQPQVTHKAQLITLDLAARKSHATLVLERERGRPAPERIWVWTAFFVPDDARGRIFSGAPVELRDPFAFGDRVTVNVTGACPWCGEKDSPANGYYARFNISTESAAAARLGDEEVSRDISTATPVVVEEGRKKTR